LQTLIFSIIRWSRFYTITSILHKKYSNKISQLVYSITILCVFSTSRSRFHICCIPFFVVSWFQELRDAADKLLFDKILFNKNHLLCCLLPPPSAASQTYNLRRRPHSQLLPQHPGHLMDSNFVTRMLYKDIYWRQSINILQLTVALLPIISLYLYFLTFHIVAFYLVCVLTNCWNKRIYYYYYYYFYY